MNKMFLPKVKDLKEMYKRNPKRFVKMMSKVDAFIGSSRAHGFIKRALDNKI